MPTGQYKRSKSDMDKIRRCLNKGRTPEVRAKATASIINSWTEEKRKKMSKLMKDV